MHCPDIYFRIANKILLEIGTARANGVFGPLDKPTDVELLKPWLAAQFQEINYPLTEQQLDAIATRFPEIDYDKGEYEGSMEEYDETYSRERTLIAAVLWWAIREIAHIKFS